VGKKQVKSQTGGRKRSAPSSPETVRTVKVIEGPPMSAGGISTLNEPTSPRGGRRRNSTGAQSVTSSGQKQNQTGASAAKAPFKDSEPAVPESPTKGVSGRGQRRSTIGPRISREDESIGTTETGRSSGERESEASGEERVIRLAPVPRERIFRGRR
jgi:hypothetical protein